MVKAEGEHPGHGWGVIGHVPAGPPESAEALSGGPAPECDTGVSQGASNVDVAREKSQPGFVTRGAATSGGSSGQTWPPDLGESDPSASERRDESCTRPPEEAPAMNVAISNLLVPETAPGCTSAALEAFYRDLQYELGEWMRRSSSRPRGAAVVVKRVAQAHGIELAESLPIPRLNRAEEAALGIGRAPLDRRRR